VTPSLHIRSILGLLILFLEAFVDLASPIR